MRFATLLSLLVLGSAASAQQLPPPPLMPAEDVPEEPSRPPEPPEAPLPPVVEVEPEAVSEAPSAAPAPAADAAAVRPGTYSLIAPREAATVLAVGELVVGQTAHGLLQASLFCAYVQCASIQVVSGALLVGGLAGGVGSYFLSSKGISGGAAQAINSGTAWGVAQGLTLMGAIGQIENPAAFIAVSSLVGTAAGFGIAGWLHPTGGQVSMANSGGIWLATLVALFASPYLNDLPGQTFFAMELVAMNVGLAAMGYLSTRFEFSRGRMFLIDTGGVIGGLIGTAAYFFANLPATTGNVLGPVVGVGVAAGLAGAVFLTRNVDVAMMNGPSLSFAPVGPRGTAGLTLGAQF